MSDMITRSIIVKADLPRVYQAWANFENFPDFMSNIKNVTNRGGGVSHWEMKGPLGITVSWDAHTTLMEENKRIAWSTKESEEGSVKTSGQVTFTALPGNQSQVTVMMQYIPKGGLPADVVANLFSNPEKQLEEDLKNFKNYIEEMPERTAF